MLDRAEHLLLITMHQTIGDGWSAGVLADELVTVYDAFSAGRASPLPPLSLQYADFAYWQRRWQFASGRRFAARNTGRSSFATHCRTASLLRPSEADDRRSPYGAAGAGVAGEPIGGCQTLRPSRRWHVVHGAGRRLEDAVASPLGRGGLRVATLVANRNRPGCPAHRAAGNTVILRTNLVASPITGGDAPGRATTLAAFANQDLPFEELVETLSNTSAPSSLRRSPGS